MIISVRNPKPGVFTMSVRNAQHGAYIDEEFSTMDTVWKAARAASEAEVDFLENRYGKEW